MSVNKVTLIGNLGADPEVNFMPSGDTVVNMRIATSRRWTDKASGEKREETEWHSLVLYNREATFAAEYLKKGHRVYVEGRLRTRKFTTKEGVERERTEIIAERVDSLTSRAEAVQG